jgi:hypothetical protein
MLLTGKLVWLSIGALTVAGSALLQMADPGHSGAQRMLGSAGDAISQTASNQIGTVYREASAQISPRLQSLPNTAGAFLRSNAATARLQFEGMANALPDLSSFASRLPGTAANLIHGGVPVAVQESTAEANSLAGKIPAVKAWKSNVDHMANMHPALSGGTARF